MKLGIMQPYFFPYLGHYALIAATDRWIVFDVVQYSVRSWMNRNRILHPQGGWQYVTVPVNHAVRGTRVRDITVHDKAAALTRILGQLTHYRKQAPGYDRVVDLVRATFAATATNLLTDLAIASLVQTCALIGLELRWRKCSEMGLTFADVEHPGGWALSISRQVGADEYVNPEGGRSLFRAAEWADAGVRISFLPPPQFQYDCGHYVFQPHLSILDVLMWNEPEVVLDAILRQQPSAFSP